MSDQQFVLRWHYHESTLLHNFPYFLDSDLLTDVTLSVGAHKVKAHKIILAMCSVYFLQLFQELQATHPVVVLHNVGFDEVKAILSFMYRGQCVVTQEQLPSLLSVAKLLKVQGLCDMKAPERQHCHNELAQEINAIDERLPNNETCDINNFGYHKFFGKYEHVENVDIKSENETEVKVHDLRREDSHSRIPTIMPEDKSTSKAIDTIPVRYEDSPYPFPSVRKIAQRDFSETCKCFLCGKYLSNQYNLRVHMETHEEAYHACQSCPHVSRSRDALRKHVSYRHPEEYHNRKRKKMDN